MSAPSPAPPERNLLFGILALQMDFVSRDALIGAMNAWVLHKSTPLGQLLVERGGMAADARDLLEPLVQRHLEMHGGDAAKSLASVGSLGSARRALEQIADPDVQASLAHVPAAGRQGADPWPTRAPSVGTPTSSGRRFRVLRPHAKGGLGQVSVALDEELRREVALKEIQDRHADHPDSRARFLLEAEITGGLEHPGIVPVYGLGSYPDGRPFYAMRFVKGDSLQQAIARFHKAEAGPRDPQERALALRQLLGRFIDVCDAIAYAHSRGVLHRDLKPGNVMLGPFGETLVVDWGLAKPLGAAAAQDREALAERPLQPELSGSATPTRAGTAIGTPAYMPPEQAAGRLDQLGPASDVYSLGATLYCLLTGKPPFEGGEEGEVLRRVQAGEFRRPREAHGGVPAALEAVCLKAMALRPQDRYAGPRALAADVERWLADEPVSAWPEPWTVRAGRWMRRHRPWVAGAVSLLAAALPLLTLLIVLSESAREKLEIEQGKTKDALDVAINNEKLADERRILAEKMALQARFDYFYFRSREDPASAMVGSARLLPGTLALNDRPLADSILLHLGAWSQEVHRLRGICLHQGVVDAVAFSPDGKSVLTGSLDKTARLWRFPQVRGDPEQVLLWTQVLTGLELGEEGMVRVLDAETWQERKKRLRKLGGSPEC